MLYMKNVTTDGVYSYDCNERRSIYYHKKRRKKKLLHGSKNQKSFSKEFMMVAGKMKVKMLTKMSIINS